MKIKKTIITAAILMAAVCLPAQNKSAGINISIWKDICTQPHDSTQTTYVNIGLLSTMNRLNGVGINALGSVVHGDMNGVQITGLANLAGGTMRGVQIAGVSNISGDNTIGVSTAGLVNITGDGTQGVTIAGLTSIGGDNTSGVMISGFMNVTGNMASGRKYLRAIRRCNRLLLHNVHAKLRGLHGYKQPPLRYSSPDRYGRFASLFHRGWLLIFSLS